MKSLLDRRVGLLSARARYVLYAFYLYVCFNNDLIPSMIIHIFPPLPCEAARPASWDMRPASLCCTLTARNGTCTLQPCRLDYMIGCYLYVAPAVYFEGNTLRRKSSTKTWHNGNFEGCALNNAAKPAEPPCFFLQLASSPTRYGTATISCASNKHPGL